MHVQLHVALPFKDLFTTLSTQRNSTEKFIWADVNFMRFNLMEHGFSRIIWIPGTKACSLLSYSLGLFLHYGRLLLNFSTAEKCNADSPLGYFTKLRVL